MSILTDASHHPETDRVESRASALRTVAVAAVGASHRTMSVEDLAHLTQTAHDVETRLRQNPAITGFVVLSTCNRFEIYVEASTPHTGVTAVLGTVAACLSPEADGLTDQLEVYVEASAVQHLLEVAAGLHSMVIGEREIVGQIRTATSASVDHLGTSLRRLFDTALTTGKAVRSSTGLGSAGRSLATAALELVAERHFDVARRTAVVVGTGSFARVVTAALLRTDCTDIRVYSASGRAEQFAINHPVTPVGEDALDDALAAADILILCSGQRRTHPALTSDRLAAARTQTSAPLPVVDLTLRGDIAAEAAFVPGVDLIDLDEIGAHAPTGQATDLLAARDLVNQGMHDYLESEAGRASAAAVTAIRAHVSSYIEREMELAEHRYDEHTAQAIARSLRRVSNALLHTPSLRAAEYAKQGQLDDYSHAVTTLFGIEVPHS